MNVARDGYERRPCALEVDMTTDLSIRQKTLCVLALLGIACACGDDRATLVIEDASLHPMDGESMLYKECSGPPYGQGSCDENQICAAMAHVPYKYCMPASPCEDGMVEVTKVACAYPCEATQDCKQYGLAGCAQNDLADVTGEAKGWCTP